MALVVPNTAEVQMLQRIVGSAATGNQIMKLYKGGPTSPGLPDEDTVLADFTECDASGYAAYTLSTANWGVTTSISGTTTATYNTDAVFTFSASQSVYGYYVVDATTPTPNLLWCESFSGGPFVIPGAGGQIQITPTVNLS